MGVEIAIHIYKVEEKASDKKVGSSSSTTITTEAEEKELSKVKETVEIFSI